MGICYDARYFLFKVIVPVRKDKRRLGLVLESMVNRKPEASYAAISLSRIQNCAHETNDRVI